MNSANLSSLESMPSTPSVMEAMAACRHAEEQLRELQSTFEQRVTERTEALRQSEELHRIAFDLAPAGMAYLGLDDRFTKVNETLCEITGYTAAELVGMSGAELTLPEDLARDAELLTAFRKGSATKHVNEKRYVRKDGSIRWVAGSTSVVTDASARPLHSIHVVRDITERKTTMDALRLANTAMESAANAIFITSRDGVIEYINPAFTKISGYDAAAAIGQKASLIRSGEHDEAFYQDLWQTILAGEIWRGETINRHRNGQVYVSEQTIAPEKNACGEITHFISVQHNITERKQAEDRVRVSEVRYRRLFEAAHDGVLLIDPATGKITDANPFMTKLLGYSRDQLVGKALFEIGLLKDEAASQEMFEKLKLERQVRYEDLPLESQEGLHQEVEVVANVYDEDGHSVIQCNIRDITARRQAEAAQHRLDGLTASNEKLEQAIIQRQVTEAALRQSEQHQKQLLEQSNEMQEQLRQLSREVLQVQEDERKRISRELHDVIAQTLSGINMRLALLQSEAGTSTKDLQEKITQTQHLVAQSVDTVHRFARDLRPAMLDDLGLIPALHSHLKDFTQQSGIHVALQAQADVEELDSTGRTVLYRITQEALTNVVRHAKARLVEMKLEKFSGIVSLEIKDDGQGFELGGKSCGIKNNRLGLLGMRERVEMINGTFHIDSKPGGPTTIRVEIPVGAPEPPPSTLSS